MGWLASGHWVLDVTFVCLLLNENCHCVGRSLLVTENLRLALSGRADPAPAGGHGIADVRYFPEFAGRALDKLEVTRLGRCGGARDNRRLWRSVGRLFRRYPPPHVSGYGSGLFHHRIKTDTDVAWEARHTG